MLPTETFAEIVAFLRLFDLGAFVVANAMCSSLAIKASAAIRWEEFPDLRFYISDQLIEITRLSQNDEDGSYDPQHVATLTFRRVKETIKFIAIAFLNCIFEDVSISGSASKRLLSAFGRVANSVIIKGVFLAFGMHESRRFSQACQKISKSDS